MKHVQTGFFHCMAGFWSICYLFPFMPQPHLSLDLLNGYTKRNSLANKSGERFVLLPEENCLSLTGKRLSILVIFYIKLKKLSFVSILLRNFILKFAEAAITISYMLDSVSKDMYFSRILKTISLRWRCQEWSPKTSHFALSIPILSYPLSVSSGYLPPVDTLLGAWFPALLRKLDILDQNHPNGPVFT